MYKNSAHPPEQDALQPIFLDTVLFTPNTPSLFGFHSHIPQHNTMDSSPRPSETDPLLPVDPPVKKPFYRPRPLWIVPFALTSALVHGMTTAPRVQVYTQLACNAAYGKQPHDHSDYILSPLLSSAYVPLLEHATVTPIPIHFPHFSHSPEHTHSEDPRQVLSERCFSDPDVQARAARLQTIVATTMGVLSVCTTAWWGHYSQKHGRTKVLAAATLGTLFTDLAFVLVSTPSPFSRHSHKFLFLAPVIEGLLGGQSTLHAAIAAYISDCTSDGSRAHIFSRFAGVSYVGFALGPTIGAFLIRHPLVLAQSFGQRRSKVQSVTAVFWVAVLCGAINAFLTLLVIPESLDKAKLRAVQKGDTPSTSAQKKPGLKKRLLGPFAIFAPRKRVVNGRMQKDWSMSWLAIAMFALFLASGVFQVKYLYAEHVFGWGAEQLGYYISFVSNVRALHTLLLMPFIISCFKPSPPAPSTSTISSNTAPTHLARSIAFDLYVARGSLLLDMISHTLVALHLSSSSLVFAGITSISALASGTTPALQSLAICILQRSSQGNPDFGALFSGLSTLAALGQAILAPLIFGFVYSGTVARFPEAVFALAAALVLVAFTATFFVRPEHRRVRKGKAPVAVAVGRRRVLVADFERGRSRVVKHIGDRGRTQTRSHVAARDDISARGSETTPSCSCPGSSDDVV
ncbi:major facilitator superfamily domain-containing protein [Lactarius hengduanensis]|nr:major facilitator superfamily domain-containing protein [Lactarius hengduanensis]